MKIEWVKFLGFNLFSLNLSFLKISIKKTICTQDNLTEHCVEWVIKWKVEVSLQGYPFLAFQSTSVRVTTKASGACSAEIPFAYAKKQFFLLGHLFLFSLLPPEISGQYSLDKQSFAFFLCLSYLPAPPLSLGLFALPWRAGTAFANFHTVKSFWAQPWNERMRARLPDSCNERKEKKIKKEKSWKAEGSWIVFLQPCGTTLPFLCHLKWADSA